MHRSGTSRLRWPARPRSFGIALAVLAIATSAVACGGAATSSDGVGVDRAAYPNAMLGGDGSFAKVVDERVAGLHHERGALQLERTRRVGK